MHATPVATASQSLRHDYFTYVFYYRWEAEQEDATIYAVVYCNREPGYWKHRIG